MGRSAVGPGEHSRRLSALLHLQHLGTKPRWHIARQLVSAGSVDAIDLDEDVIYGVGIDRSFVSLLALTIAKISSPSGRSQPFKRRPCLVLRLVHCGIRDSIDKIPRTARQSRNLMHFPAILAPGEPTLARAGPSSIWISLYPCTLLTALSMLLGF